MNCQSQDQIQNTEDVHVLQERIAELETLVANYQDQLQAAQDRELRSWLILENMTELVALMNADGIYQYTSPSFRYVLGYQAVELQGQPLTALLHPDDYVMVTTLWKRLPEMGVCKFTARYRHSNGTWRWLEAHGLLIDDDVDSTIVLVARDITEHKAALETQIQLQEQLVRSQAARLAELAAPLLPIAHQVIVMPLIGMLDLPRVQQVAETLLHGLSTNRAHTAILDITGGTLMDRDVAQHFLQAAHAAQLCGARVLITGIRPEVAHVLSDLSDRLNGIMTYSTLQQGIADTLQLRSRRFASSA